MTQKKNMLNVQSPDCITIATIVHEIMHALGCYHEHVRPDRDDYVSIDTSALKEKYQKDQSYWDANYARMSSSQVDLYGIPYDYTSVMHYSKYAAAASYSRPVLVAKKPWKGDFGNEVGMTDSDVKMLNKMYC
ncbi:zinc metalloproteinase nas-4-like [Toxorhynchites rutilus septentrionalis]|uniref:zinc metalloproteinase nas-4-like n=1 Tax=Toxorhynchites rutilus septentrionalis TaxID=329112 RepID=UPI0024789D7C|nr:zinc metalloproteinase nas-4-like [Toxorhynchites rutilus septentrionalis]